MYFTYLIAIFLPPDIFCFCVSVLFGDIFSTQLYWRIIKTALTNKLSTKDSIIAYIAGFNSLSAFLNSLNNDPGEDLW